MEGVGGDASFERSADTSAVQTAGGGGQSSVQRSARHEQRGNVTMSERSQIESEATHADGTQTSAARSLQQFDKHEKGARKREDGKLEHAEDTYSKVNERSEAQSRRQLPGGELASQSSSVSTSETRQKTSVADLGGGATQRQSVTKRSQVSEVSEVSQSSSQSSSTNRQTTEPRRLGAGGRSASLQTENLDTFGTTTSRGGGGGGAPSSSRAGSSAGGGILRELEKLLADEDRYEQARRAVRRDDSDSLNARSDQIRREVDSLVASFFDRKRDRTGRSEFFDRASRRAEQLARDFARDDDDPWREEEERWRRRGEVRRTSSDDFFEDAVRRAETLVREMRDRKETRRRDEQDVFSRYGAEIDQFFSDSRGRRGGSRGTGDTFHSTSAFAENIVRDFLQDAGGRGSEEPWANRHRERADSHSTNVDIDEVLSQASTIGRERATRPARPNTSDVDIEELSASSRRSRTAGADRLVDDIVRQFAADEFEDDDTLRGVGGVGGGGAPRGMDRQTSNTSTVDEAASLRPDSRLSELEAELQQAEQQQQQQTQQRRQEEEQLTQQQRREAEEREDRERRRLERQEGAMDEQKRRQLEELEQAEQKAELYRQERELRRQQRAAEQQQADEEAARALEQAEKRRRAVDRALAGQTETGSLSEQQLREERMVTESYSRQESSATEQASTAEERSSRREELSSSSRHEEQSSSRREEHSSQQSVSGGEREAISTSAEHASESASRQQRTDQRSSPADAASERGETRGTAAETQESAETAETTATQETAEVRSEASAAALKRAEELLFGFVPDWEREEQRWSQVRTERIAESTGDKKTRDLLADYKPMRHTREDDARAQRRHERQTESYEHLLSGDVWRGGGTGGTGGRARTGGDAESVLSELRSARQSTASSAQSARSQFSARKAESMRESSDSARPSGSSRSSKLDEFRSFKSDLWQDK